MSDDYTNRPTHLRIFSERSLGIVPFTEWHIDGADDDLNFTEDCWSYETFTEAVAALSEFVNHHDDYDWQFRPGRRGTLRNTHHYTQEVSA